MSPNAISSGGQPVEILLVEDNPGDVRLTREALREGKIVNNLHHVKDGVEALAFLRRAGEYAGSPRPDLILLDLNLPRKDGRETLAEIQMAENVIPQAPWNVFIDRIEGFFLPTSLP